MAFENISLSVAVEFALVPDGPSPCGANYKFNSDARHNLRPPESAVPVNHFIQTAFIPLGNGMYNIVKLITFQSDGEKGMVKPELARTYRMGDLHLVNLGSSSINGMKVFQYLFEALGGFQIKQWELQGSAGS